MSDQHVVTDWRAYFESLGPGTPPPNWQAFQPMYAGPVACSTDLVRPLDGGWERLA